MGAIGKIADTSARAQPQAVRPLGPRDGAVALGRSAWPEVAMGGPRWPGSRPRKWSPPGCAPCTRRSPPTRPSSGASPAAMCARSRRAGARALARHIGLPAWRGGGDRIGSSGVGRVGKHARLRRGRGFDIRATRVGASPAKPPGVGPTRRLPQLPQQLVFQKSQSGK